MQKIFNFALIVVTLTIVSFLIYSLGLAFGGLASLLSGVLAWLVVDKIRETVNVLSLRRRWENVYVVSCHPKTGEPASIPEELEGLVVNAPFRLVWKTARKYERHLQESGNKFAADDCPEKSRVKVLTLIYQDGRNASETWGEFEERVVQEIREDRAVRNEDLRNADFVWYMKHGNRQAGVRWSRE